MDADHPEYGVLIPCRNTLYRHIGLDYFGIDSAELPDSRLLVFEVDVAMVVHNMDSAKIYPYKHVAMRKLFDAFIEAVRGSAIACTPSNAQKMTRF